MVEGKLWQLVYRVPECLTRILCNRAKLLLPVDSDKCIVSHRDHTPLRVTGHLAKSVKLLHMQIAPGGKHIWATLGSIITAFFLLQNITGQAKPILIRFFISLD